MILGSLLALVVVIVLGTVIIVTWERPWIDSDDCTGIVQHSVRVPSPANRWDLWCSRYSLFNELGDKFAPRLTVKFSSTVRPRKK